jgi:hypothetical protein
LATAGPGGFDGSGIVFVASWGGCIWGDGEAVPPFGVGRFVVGEVLHRDTTEAA